MKYEVNYMVRDEEGRAVTMSRRFFDNEEEAKRFSEEVNGRIIAYKERSKI